MKDGVVTSTSLQAVGDLWKMKLLFLCVVYHLSLSCLFCVHKKTLLCCFFSIGNKGFWERKSNKSGGCGLWN